MSFIIFRFILVYNCNVNTVLLVFCVHDKLCISLSNRKNAPHRFDQVCIQHKIIVTKKKPLTHIEKLTLQKYNNNI